MPGFFLARKYLVQHLSPDQLRRYERQNFHGKTVNLSGGIKVAAGCLTSALALSGNSAAKFGDNSAGGSRSSPGIY